MLCYDDELVDGKFLRFLYDVNFVIFSLKIIYF